MRSLARLKPGERARVVGIRAGRGLVERLSAMGITPGVMIRFVRGSQRGPVIVDLRGGRVILGRGMAERIEVEQQGERTREA